jgi:cysteine-rich repeat protein
MKTQKTLALIFAAALVSTLLGSSLRAATMTVTADAPDVIAADGICSLREAISAANSDTANPDCTAVGGFGDEIINLPAGTYTTALASTCEDLNTNGDYDIRTGTSDTVTINGAGAATTIIDGNDVDRVFDLTISTTNPTLILSGVTVRNGTARLCPGFGDGGGIRVQAGDLTIDATAIVENEAVNGGGISAVGNVILTNSLISANNSNQSGGGDGGGIFSAIGALTVINSTISGNTADGSGGGVALTGNEASGAKSFRNATVTNNTAGVEAGGLFIDDAASDIFIRNTILAANIDANTGTVPDCGNQPKGDIFSEGFNFIGDETSCDGSFGATGDQFGTMGAAIDPLLAPLADNGGPTFTHALLTGSPAIDAGNNVEGCTSDDAQTTVLTDDQRAFTRPVDGDDDGANRCDIGAFELQQTELCGDGIEQTSEQCDDANTTPGDGCAADCTIEPTTCGDASIDNVEECDDGNTTPGDGCSELCVVEPGFSCSGSVSVCVAGCGDGAPVFPEECDDGNFANNDGCSAACRIENATFCATNPTDCVIVLVGDGGCGLIRNSPTSPSGSALFFVGSFFILGLLNLVKPTRMR